ncbi:DUF58 domain-containing protein [Thiomicrospira sp. ALE5]|uniref:DUF58 domain-containing protein n=1 Tax=Thiomicrospira sp. ALE5 TaxID=748650 RepID=UPI0008EC7930|nr:DUF58 domain-containing protein [Thiomicrospira sp. ALE5]SFR52765.1 Protein of unknown function DUF58 [Thiomicrospira sp. ALE5]
MSLSGMKKLGLTKTALTAAPIMSAAEIAAWAQAIAADLVDFKPNQRASSQALFGDQWAKTTGQGMDYADSRPYYAGDELRHLNWRAWARSGQAMTKVFQQERQQAWCVCVDQGPSMRFGSHKRLKVTQAMRFTGWLAWWAQQQGVQWQLTQAHDQLYSWPTPSARDIFMSSMNHLAKPCPPQAAVNQQPFAQRIKPAQQAWLPGAKLWLITDFADWAEQDWQWLYALNAHYDVQAVSITDPVEQQLPKRALLALQQGARRWLLNRDSLEAYNAWAQQQREHLATRLSGYGIAHWALSTQDELIDFRRLAVERAG